MFIHVYHCIAVLIQEFIVWYQSEWYYDADKDEQV